MTVDDIKHLGTLSRLSLTDTEAEAFRTEIGSILEYVSAVSKLAGEASVTKTVGVIHNVFRGDEVTNEPGQYSEVLLGAAPHRRGDFFEVKKIIDQGD
jgi:aspartyl-tRNA(Asn)/glutamyl-tRNA(Gln) amidotransferase subunit C